LDWIEFWLEIGKIEFLSMAQYGKFSRECLLESWGCWVLGWEDMFWSCKYVFWGGSCWVRAAALARDFWL
jgi:hypothetical protein